MPGLIVTQHSGDGRANQYFLRGFNLDHGTDLATTFNGMPANMRTNAHGHGYTDLNFVMPELVNSITYKKGPYFANEGDFATAGAVDIDYVDSLPQGIASVELGSHAYRRGVLANSNQIGPGTLLYGFEWLTENGPWDLPEGVHKLNGVLRYTMPLGDGEKLGVTAMAYRNAWKSTDQVPQRAINSGVIDRFGNIDPTDGGYSSRYSLSTDWYRPLADGLMLMVTHRVAPFCRATLGATGRPLSFKQFDNGTVVIGGELIGIADLTNRHGEVDFPRLVKSARTVTDLFPHLRHLGVNRAWAGVEAFTEDELPVISASRKASNLYYSFGCCGSGFQLGPGCGKLVSELMLDGAPSISLDAFAIDRFGRDASACGHVDSNWPSINFIYFG